MPDCVSIEQETSCRIILHFLSALTPCQFLMIKTILHHRYFPTLLTVLLAVFNDGAMIALSKDRVTPSQLPNSWKLQNIFICGIVYGVYLVIVLLGSVVRFSIEPLANNAQISQFLSPGSAASGVKERFLKAKFTISGHIIAWHLNLRYAGRVLSQ